MAVAWWAESFSIIQTELNQLVNESVGDQSQYGLATVELQKLRTQMEAIAYDYLVSSATEFKKLSTSASAGQVYFANIQTAVKKLVTQALAGVTAPVTWQGTGPLPTGVGIPVQNNWTAPAGTDVYIAAVMDRSGSFTGATFGGEAGTLMAEVLHNNNASTGRTALWRFAGKGDGTNKTFSITGSGSGWFGVCIFAFSGVVSVGTPVTTYGSGTSPSQVVTEPGVQILGRGAGGAGVGTPSAFSGVTNRVNQGINGSSLAVNQVEVPGTTGATTQNYPYGYIFLPLRNT
ncbi:hypothetical protein SEA_KANDZ_32 [Mycobacterium phage KandZ]|uniref:Minor tail protein n=1 Tax=Mycobacterium phage KandZ TaxID=2419979 RepID=A0A3G2KGS5_9CAUD|nr:hypothetical protein SEA_KANDZ_32 [Mycobacterium phage KandZ]